MCVLQSTGVHVWIVVLGLTMGMLVGTGYGDNGGDEFQLPEPDRDGDTSVEKSIIRRRSERNFTEKPLTMQQVSQLAWAAQGITDKTQMKRAAPSAGATYPMEVMFVVGEDGVEDLPKGVYRYDPKGHLLKRGKSEDCRSEVARAALRQSFIADAPVSIVLAGDVSRTAQRYGDRAQRYVYMEAGHVAQNVYLQVEALEFGTVSVGAFQDAQLKKACGMPDEWTPMYVMPIGYTR